MKACSLQGQEAVEEEGDPAPSRQFAGEIADGVTHDIDGTGYYAENGVDGIEDEAPVPNRASGNKSVRRCKPWKGGRRELFAPMHLRPDVLHPENSSDRGSGPHGCIHDQGKSTTWPLSGLDGTSVCEHIFACVSLY